VKANAMGESHGSRDEEVSWLWVWCSEQEQALVEVNRKEHQTDCQNLQCLGALGHSEGRYCAS
jgi:hypothetical protein